MACVWHTECLVDSSDIVIWRAELDEWINCGTVRTDLSYCEG